MPKDNEYDGIDRRESTPLLFEKLDRINGNVEAVKDIAEDNRRALRGYNDKPGMVAGVQANADNIEKLEKKSNRNDFIVGVGTIIGSVIGFIFGSE